MSTKHDSSTIANDLVAARAAWRASRLAPFETKNPARANLTDAHDLYTPADLTDSSYEAIGYPGAVPFTRGVQPNMYRGRFWTMRQYAGFGTAKESNERYRFLLDQGQTGLSVAFDLPTQMGRDSDHERALGEVGKVGVAIDSLDDMATLFDKIPLDKVSTSMTINSTASILLAMYVVVAEQQGVASKDLRGTIQNDILKEYIARGTYIFPPRPSLRIINNIFAWSAKHAPKWNTISISGYHMREAGSSAAQELAFTLADGIAYVETAVAAGLDVNVFGQQLSFFFNAHNNLIEEVAKFRAARRLWASIMKERFGATNEKSLALKFHVQTAGSTLQAQQPLVNAVRTTLQALAAVLGGCQSLHTNSYDEALSLPTELSATLALRTQQVIAHESGVADIVDALGGSYAVEAITNRLESEARAYIKKIDELGGMVAAIEQGYVQREIQNTAYQYQLTVERGEQVLVGVNRFKANKEEPVPIMKLDPTIERTQVERLRALRTRRNNEECQRALGAITESARTDANLMPLIIAAVRQHATVGEISDALRSVFGEHIESLTI